MSNSLKKSIQTIFLPALLLSVFLSTSIALFNFSQNTLKLEIAQIPFLKVSTLLPQIILTLFLFIFSIYNPFEKVFRITLMTLIGTSTVLVGLMFFEERAWFISLLYVVLGTFNLNLFSLFIWGFINRLASLSEGLKYYIPFTLVLAVTGPTVSKSSLTMIGASKWSLMTTLISAIVLMICSFFTFTWSWKKLPDNLIHPNEESLVLKIRFPFLRAAYLLAGCAMVKSLLETLFKFQIKIQFPDIPSYLKQMTSYSMSVVFSTVAFSIIWAFLGTWLLLKKGWKTTSLYASFSIMIGTLIFLNLSLQNAGIFTGLLVGTASTLFFPLIQILYLSMPYQYRFRTKVVTEMIALPLMQAIPSLTIQGLLIIFGSMTSMTLYLKILILILIGILFICSYSCPSKEIAIRKT